MSAPEKIEALELLRKSAMERYTWRTSVEWKLCIALWTAFAAFLGSVLTGNGIAGPKVQMGVMTIIVAIGIICLHGWWVYGLAQVQRVDNDVSYFFRDLMMKDAEVTFPEHIQKGIDTLKEKNARKWFWHWSRSFQLGVTALLAISAVIAVFSVSGEQSSQKKIKGDDDVEVTVGQNSIRYKTAPDKDCKISFDKDGRMEFQILHLGDSNSPAH